MFIMNTLMSELAGQPPFIVDQSSVERIQRNAIELGLADKPYVIIGTTALWLYGYIQGLGRMDFFTTPEACGELAVSGGNLLYSREPGPDGVVNEMLVADSDTANNLRPAHVLARWEAASDLQEVLTYDALVPQAQKVHGFLAVNPVTSLSWLCARHYPLDRSAAYKALGYIQQTEPSYTYDAFSKRVRQIWPRRRARKVT